MHELAYREEVSVDDIAREIDAGGAACLRSLVSEDWLDQAREYVSSYLRPDGRNELFVVDPGAEAGSFAHALITDPAIEFLLSSIARAGYAGLRDDDYAIENELRLAVGHDPRKPLWFHYDSCVLSMVVPILIPVGDADAPGHLLLCPDRRPYRRLVVSNILDKLVTQNNLYRWWFTRHLRRNPSVAKEIPLEVGNVYLFWGYKTFHAPLPSPPGTVRATLLLHFGAVHGRSRFLAVAKRLRQRARECRPDGNTIRPRSRYASTV